VFSTNNSPSAACNTPQLLALEDATQRRKRHGVKGIHRCCTTVVEHEIPSLHFARKRFAYLHDAMSQTRICAACNHVYVDVALIGHGFPRCLWRGQRYRRSPTLVAR
jgi:hypothetical protein